MKNKIPILSICIPTYNRANYIKKTLESITTQQEFIIGEVEVVISDNASTDNTEEVVQKFLEEYENIFYYKNIENVVDKNIPLVLDKANGTYRKLWNDTMIPEKNALKMILDTIKENIEDKPVIFWNQQIKYDKSVVAFGVDEAIKYISYWATSVSCYGVWAEDFIYNEDGCNKCLWQVSNLFRDISKKEKVVINTKNFYTMQIVEKKDISYGLFKVFYTNFLGLIKEQNVSQKTYDKVEKDLLLKFFKRYVLIKKLIPDSCKYSETEPLEKLLKDTYKKKRYYWIYQVGLVIGHVKIRIKKY